LSCPALSDATLARAAFIDRVLTSHFPGEVAKRLRFADGEVAALYTLSRKAPLDVAQPVLLVVATFLPRTDPAGGT